MKRYKWSFLVYYDFNKFLDFLHSPTVQLESGEICKFIITSIEIEDSGFAHVNRGHYVVVFDLIPFSQQLTLF